MHHSSYQKDFYMSGRNCSGVMRSGNRITLHLWTSQHGNGKVKRLLTGVLQKFPSDQLYSKNVFDLNILNNSENVRMESINCCM